MRDHDAVPADLAVVSDLAKIIDLARFADHGVPDAAAVDRHAGADLDVVLDDDAAGLRNLLLRGIFGVAETVLADAAAGMDDDAIADQRMRDRAAGADPAVAADRDVGTDDGVCGDDAARADFRARSDDGAGIDRDFAFESGPSDGRSRLRKCRRLEQRTPAAGIADRAFGARRRRRDKGARSCRTSEPLRRVIDKALRHQAGAGAGLFQRVDEFVARR